MALLSLADMILRLHMNVISTCKNDKVSESVKIDDKRIGENMEVGPTLK